MKKKSILYNDEINLTALLKIIWNGKIKIVLITVISFLIGFGYVKILPSSYLGSLIISPTENSKLIKYIYLYEILNNFEKGKKSKPNSELFLNSFIKELNDFEEFAFVLKNTKKISEMISHLSIDEQEKALFKYVGLMQISKQNKSSNNWVLSFRWHDPIELQDILDETLNLALINLENSVYDELNYILEMQKKIELNKKIKKIEFLKEQSMIAKELDISDNQVDNFNLSQSNVLFNISTTDVAYYLRGYKAIDKEIELSESRDNFNYKFYEKELNSLKKTNIEWVVFNVNLTKLTSITHSRLILLISIFLGLTIGVFYVVLSYILKLQTVSKKKIN